MSGNGGSSTRVAAALLALSTLVAVAGCATAHPTLDELDGVPGTDAVYPRGEPLGSSRLDSDWSLVASNPAVIKRDACTRDAAPRVRRWYADLLEGVGWTRDPGTWLASGLGDVGWARDDLRFRLRLASTGAGSGACVTSIRTVVT